MNVPRTKWSNEDENTLIELVEKYECKGKSKQEAFEMVANIINRTKAACASRYRFLKKKEHLSDKLNRDNEYPIVSNQVNPPLSIEKIIEFLMSFDFHTQLHEQNAILREKLTNYQNENEELNKKIINLKSSIQTKQEVLRQLVELKDKIL